MNKRFRLLVKSILLGISLSAANIDFAAGGTDGSTSFEESHVISYPSGYKITSEGASSYQGVGNVKNSLYYGSLDFFNMKSMDTLTLLPKYKTYQQTTKVTCIRSILDKFQE